MKDLVTIKTLGAALDAGKILVVKNILEYNIIIDQIFRTEQNRAYSIRKNSYANKELLKRGKYICFSKHLTFDGSIDKTEFENNDKFIDLFEFIDREILNEYRKNIGNFISNKVVRTKENNLDIAYSAKFKHFEDISRFNKVKYILKDDITKAHRVQQFLLFRGIDTPGDITEIYQDLMNLNSGDYFWNDPDNNETSRMVTLTSGDPRIDEIVLVDKGTEVDSSELLPVKNLQGLLSKDEIGTENDWDQLFYQKDFASSTVVDFETNINEKKYFIEINCEGEQRVFLKDEQLIKSPEKLLSNKDNEELYFSDECWLQLYIYDKNRNLIFSSYEDAGTVYGSVQDAISDILEFI